MRTKAIIKILIPFVWLWFAYWLEHLLKITKDDWYAEVYAITGWGVFIILASLYIGRPAFEWIDTIMKRL